MFWPSERLSLGTFTKYSLGEQSKRCIGIGLQEEIPFGLGIDGVAHVDDLGLRAESQFESCQRIALHCWEVLLSADVHGLRV